MLVFRFLRLAVAGDQAELEEYAIPLYEILEMVKVYQVWADGDKCVGAVAIS